MAGWRGVLPAEGEPAGVTGASIYIASICSEACAPSNPDLCTLSFAPASLHLFLQGNVWQSLMKCNWNKLIFLSLFRGVSVMETFRVPAISELQFNSVCRATRGIRSPSVGLQPVNLLDGVLSLAILAFHCPGLSLAILHLRPFDLDLVLRVGLQLHVFERLQHLHVLPEAPVVRFAWTLQLWLHQERTVESCRVDGSEGASCYPHRWWGA